MTVRYDIISLRELAFINYFFALKNKKTLNKILFFLHFRNIIYHYITIINLL